MNNEPSSRSRCLVDMATVLVRWSLGAMFVYLGLIKAMQPWNFLNSVLQYDLVQSSLLLNAIAAALPWFEVFCGVLLLAGIAVRGSALTLIAMLVPFTLVVIQRTLAIHQTSAIPFCAVKFDCGCGTGEVLICRKLLWENFIPLLVSCWLLTGRGRKLCARYRLI